MFTSLLKRLSDTYDHLLETDTVSTLRTGDSFLSQIYDLVKRADTDTWGEYDKNEVIADFQWYSLSSQSNSFH